MNYTTYFSKQARRPAGLFGRMYMSRVFDKGNADLNALVYENLAVKENDHILEIGFGTGTVLNKIAGRLENGCVEGIDFSKSMVSVAQRKNRKFIRCGKVAIHTGDFNDISFCDSAFEAVFTVNTIYFWKNPELTIAKICRILKPGGKVLIGFNGKKEMVKKSLDKDVFRYYFSEDVAALLSGPGVLEDIHTTSVKGTHKTGYCAVGIKHLEK